MKSLVRSTLLVSVLGGTSAMADVTYFTAAGDLESATTGAGLSELYVETFEEHTITGPYDIFPGPLTYGVPNGNFVTGLSAEGLTVATNDGASLSAVLPSPYWPNITSTAVGELSGPSSMVMSFDDGVPAVGFKVYGIDTFTADYPDTLAVTVYDVNGVMMDTLTYSSVDSENGAFIGVMSDVAIGSIEVRGTRFEIDQPEYLDDVTAYGSVGGVYGDVDGDGVVGFSDIVAVLAAWGDCDGCSEDVDGDGAVGFSDVVDVLANWS